MSTSSPTPQDPSGLLDAMATAKPSIAPLSALAARPLRHLVKRLLRGLQHGTLTIELPDGERLEGRGAAPGPHASVVLHRWRPLLRLLLHGDIGLACSYRDGDWSSPDLASLMASGLRNEPSWAASLEAALPARWLHRLRHLARRNTRRGSRHNIAFHYDLGNDFYAQWLDEELIYSSALYARGDESLEVAQAAKLDRILDLLALETNTSVLEIGCGWGALAVAMARRHRARVTGLTLSAEQLAHARRRAVDEGLAARLDLRLQDYRDVGGQYDRIVSIEMLEAVGEDYWPLYFDTLRRRLKPDGVAVLQVITIADAQFDRYREGADFIQRFIFPGGMLPSEAALHAHAQRAGMVLEKALSFGEGYAATLVQWRERFLRAWPAIEKLGFDASFRRLWEYYLCYCEAGFRAGRVDVGLYTLTFPGGAASTAARPEHALTTPARRSGPQRSRRPPAAST